MQKYKNYVKQVLQKTPIVNSIYKTYFTNEPTCLVVSYPKSGRTWLRILIAKALASQVGDLKSVAFEPNRVIKDHQINDLWFGFTHDGEGNAAKYIENYSSLETDHLYKDKVIIFLARDPRDVLVSHYWHRLSREKDFEGSLSDFIRHPVWGIDRLIDFYSRWSRYQQEMPNFMLIKYESLHRQTATELKNIFSFINFNIDNQHVLNAVEFAKIENLRKLSIGKLQRVKHIAPEDLTNPESFKIRKGKVAGYVDYLSDTDINFINQKLKSRSSSVFGYAADIN